MWITFLLVFFFNDTATTEIYTLSLHDALPICGATFAEYYPAASQPDLEGNESTSRRTHGRPLRRDIARTARRSEEHTSELQSRQYLVCRLLLEKKNSNEGIDLKSIRMTSSHAN